MMSRRRKLAILAAVGLTAAALLALLAYRRWRADRVTFITGAVLMEDVDPNKQQPIGDAKITARAGDVSGESTSDASGFFRLRLRPAVTRGRPVRLVFQHPEYLPLETTKPAGDEILIVRMPPKAPAAERHAEPPRIPVANVRVRYGLKSMTTANVGSAVRTFEVPNTGNVPCAGRPPCSPDGKWKATLETFSLEAGAGRQFRNVRVSCIAGPCAFTRVETDEFSRGGPAIRVSVRNWSDRVVYLVEAEVTQAMASDTIRHSYPAIFGRSMDFTLPAAAQGPSIEAEVEGAEIVFPLGPKHLLSWATCTLETGTDRTRLYRCELKPPYYFK